VIFSSVSQLRRSTASGYLRRTEAVHNNKKVLSPCFYFAPEKKIAYNKIGSSFSFIVFPWQLFFPAFYFFSWKKIRIETLPKWTKAWNPMRRFDRTADLSDGVDFCAKRIKASAELINFNDS
jgi:hypothetical protein